MTGAARVGKIARLPHKVREELNRRLQDGEEGRKLVVWLNSLPEAQAVLAEGFGGVPISSHNLSQYRKRGYREWLVEQQTLAHLKRVAKRAGKLDRAARAELTDRFAIWVANLYARAAGRLERADGDDEKDWKLLRELCHDLAVLRRGDHYSRQLGLEEERLNMAKGPEPENPSELSEEERRRRIREIFQISEDYAWPGKTGSVAGPASAPEAVGDERNGGEA